MLVLVTLCIQFLGLRASRVSNLAGIVELPMARSWSCNKWYCPFPNRSDNTSIVDTIFAEVDRMPIQWSQDRPYSYTYSEPLADGRYRTFIGSELSCVKSDQGIYSCRTSPADFCYVKVLLAFQMYSSVQIGTQIISGSNTGHRQTVQVAIYGTIRTRVSFNVSCLDGEECLDEEVKVISLQYKCTETATSNIVN